MVAEIKRYDSRSAMLLCIYGQQAQVRPVVEVTGKHNCVIFLDPRVCFFIRSSAKLKEMVQSVGERLDEHLSASWGHFKRHTVVTEYFLNLQAQRIQIPSTTHTNPTCLPH